jgi:transglutaminase-like putative cysteine protease/predicted esterase
MIASLLPLLLALPVADGDAAETPTWDRFVTEAAARHGEAGRRAAAFLAEHRPARDAGIDGELLLENLELALAARERFPWAKELPEELFLNDVLPYAVLDETRERWRPRLLEVAAPLVAECETAAEAAQALNRGLFNAVEVHYNTGRKKPNQSPAESMAQGRATCTGLSILLVDACRAVGVPARVAGVASWHDKRGNHTWVEIHDGERWRFTGADEYDANGLDRGWFAGDASKARHGDPVFGVWASSFGPGEGVFPMVWAPEDRSVPGVDVTRTYAPEAAAGAAAAAVRFVRLWDREGGERLVAEVEALDGSGEVVATGRTRAGRADLNDMPALRLAPGAAHTLRLGVAGRTRTATLAAADAGEATLDLAWNELALSEQEAERLVAERFAARCAELREERAAELEAMALVSGDHTLKLLRKDFGEAPEGGRSLWISMHGGGGAPAEVNDQQWRNQIRLYTLDEGIYVAPRAPTDTWNLWHQGHIDDLFDRLIETLVATEGVNPDRVYLLGYSAGGDGVYQLAPRMADRFAAASMMAGHPNDASPLGLRNLPFAIFMGGADAAYKRNEVAAAWGERLAELRAADPEGYPHRVTIYEGLGHWMDGRDAEGLPWMAGHTRDPWPKRVVWRQSGRTHDRFYWLAVGEDGRRGGALVTATVSGNTIALESEDLKAVTLRLRDGLVDLDGEIVVTAGGAEVFRGRVPRTEAAIDTSLAERNDPRSAATALLPVSW